MRWSIHRLILCRLRGSRDLKNSLNTNFLGLFNLPMYDLGDVDDSFVDALAEPGHMAESLRGPRNALLLVEDLDIFSTPLSKPSRSVEATERCVSGLSDLRNEDPVLSPSQQLNVYIPRIPIELRKSLKRDIYSMLKNMAMRLKRIARSQSEVQTRRDAYTSKSEGH
jgi:hypothetical protein